LEFTVYDKGLIGSKTEGKVTLPSGSFYPSGFNGMLPINGLPAALLQLVVQPAGGTTSTYALGASTGVTYAASTAAGTYSMPAASGGVTYSSPMTYSAGVPASAAYSATPAASPMTYSPAPTMMSPSTTYGTSPTYGMSQTAVMQSYSQGAPTATYSPSVPTYVGSSSMISTTPAMPMQQTNVAPTVLPQQTYTAAPSSTTYMQQPQTYMVQGGQPYGTTGSVGTNAYKLAVTIVHAQGLRQLNHFTGDHPYVMCEVKHNSSHKRTKFETKPVTTGDTLNPIWSETQELEPWHEGEPLEFTIYDKGLIGSKTEGKAMLTPEMFFPNGYNGMVAISGLPQALLNVSVRVLGPSVITTEENSGFFSSATAATETVVTPGGVMQTVSKKNRGKKLKKKSKSGCC